MQAYLCSVLAARRCALCGKAPLNSAASAGIRGGSDPRITVGTAELETPFFARGAGLRVHLSAGIARSEGQNFRHVHKALGVAAGESGARRLVDQRKSAKTNP